MNKISTETFVGLFMIAGIICLAYLSVRLGGMEVLGNKKGYELRADFSNIGGLKNGSSVVIAGVEVGRVKAITLEDYQAKVIMQLPSDLLIQEDAIASIRTKGLIGEKYVEITPGGSDRNLESGEEILETEPAIDVEQLISNYVFGKL